MFMATQARQGAGMILAKKDGSEQHKVFVEEYRQGVLDYVRELLRIMEKANATK